MLPDNSKAASPLRPRCRPCRQNLSEACLSGTADRIGRPRLQLRCPACGSPCGSLPVRKRPRFGLLAYLIALEEVGVTFGLDGPGVIFDKLLNHRGLLAEWWHHASAIRRRITPASAPWPPAD